MSRLGRALGEIASEIFKRYSQYLVSPDSVYSEIYTNSGDVLTELRNIRKMLTRASGGDLLPVGHKLFGLNNGGVIEELEALAMLFKSGAVTIDVKQKDIFPIDINDFTELVFSKTATCKAYNSIYITDSEVFHLHGDDDMLLKVTRPDGNVENHILRYTEPEDEGYPNFVSTTDKLVFIHLADDGNGGYVPNAINLGVTEGTRPEGEYTVKVYYKPISGGIPVIPDLPHVG